MSTLNGQQIIGLMTKGHLTKTQKKEINQNGEGIKPDEGFDAFSEVTVNVPTYITVASEDDLPETAEEGTIAVISEE